VDLGGFGGGAGNPTGSGQGGGGAGLGGAIFNMGADGADTGSGTLVLINSTLTGNTAKGGAGYQGGSGLGGAIFNLDGLVTLIYTTDDANTVTAGAGNGNSNGSADGGALYNLADGNDIRSGGAVKANLTLVNSILATTVGGTDLYNNAPTAADTTLIDGETSLIQSFSLLNGPGALKPLVMPDPITVINTDPNLAALASNGGPTQTQALQAPFSPAFQGATPITAAVTFQNGTFGPITSDQRGDPRSTTIPSMGAFETQPANTTANPQTTTFTNAKRSVTLTAKVVDPNDSSAVTGGLVTFTVEDSTNKVVGKATSIAPDTTGTATVSYALPAGQAVGTYTIHVAYSDTSGNFVDNSDTSATLTINPLVNPVTVAANNTTVPLSSATSVSLSATVTSTSGPVNEGQVTFTLEDSTGATIGSGTKSGTVNKGLASVSYALPAPLSRGDYTILVSYADATPGGFNDDGTDTPGTLTVTPASVTVAANSTSLAFNPTQSSVSLTASVTDGGTKINEGTVTFTLKDAGGKTIGTATTSNAVTNGVASVTYPLSSPLNQGTYSILVSYTDAAGNYVDDGTDTTGTLTITSATATVVGSSSSLTYNPAQTSVTLSASVTSAAGTVNEGTVTFTLKTGPGLGITIGTPTISPTVTNGIASVVYAVPTPLNVGTYSVLVSYTDSKGNFTDDGTDTPGTLTVNAAPAVTTAQSASTPFSTSQQVVTLTAKVTSTAGTVKEGQVTFTVVDGGGHMVGTTSAVGTVIGSGPNVGTASANYTLPANLAVGTYTINVAYTDSTGNFVDGGDVSAPLTVGTAKATVAGATTTISFNPKATTVSLSATVTSTGGTVNEGTVSFTLEDSLGHTIGTTTKSPTVTGGNASVSYAVPTPLSAGTYQVLVSYTDSSGNFVDDGTDSKGSLTVQPLGATTIASGASTSFSALAQTVPLSAAVTSSAGNVGEGTVTFTVLQGSTKIAQGSGMVLNGTVTAPVTLSAKQAAGSYTIQVSYADSLGNYTDAVDTGNTLTINPASTTVTGASLTVATGTATIQPTATVSAPPGTGKVNEGSVLFSLAVPGLPPIQNSGNVFNGGAFATLPLPAGLALGSYQITATYVPGPDYVTSTDTTPTLTVTLPSPPSTSGPSSLSAGPLSFRITSAPLATVVQGFAPDGSAQTPGLSLPFLLFPFPVIGAVTVDSNGNFLVHISGLFFGFFPFPMDVLFNPSGTLINVTF
jgi:hypothetical protein